MIRKLNHNNRARVLLSEDKYRGIDMTLMINGVINFTILNELMRSTAQN